MEDIKNDKDISIETLRRLIAMDNKGYNDAVQKLFQRYHTIKLMNGDYDSVHPRIKEVRNFVQEYDAGKWTEWIFMTVNPRPDVILQDIVKYVDKAKNKKWITKYAYTYEQRSESIDTVKGIHVHMLLYRGTKKMHEVQREFKNTFKKICDTDNMHCLNFQKVKPDHIVRRYNYIAGVKKDEYKHPRQHVDKIWRENVGLEHIYTHDINYFSELQLKYAREKTDNAEEEDIEEDWETEDQPVSKPNQEGNLEAI